MTGRPSSYTDEIAAEIVQRLASGETLTKILADDDMPHPATVYRWAATRPSFREAMTRAREAGADVLTYQIIDIADDDRDPQRARNRIDARKWLAGVINPRKYGQKVELTVNERPSLADARQAALERLGRPIVDQPIEQDTQDVDLLSYSLPDAGDKQSPDRPQLLDLDEENENQEDGG